MNMRLWMRIFLHILMLVSALISLIFIVLVFGAKLFTFSDFLKVSWINIPLYVIIIAVVLAATLLYSAYIAASLNEPFEEVKNRLNWLVMDKYQHSIFEEEVDSGSWFDENNIIIENINRLRVRLMQLTNDLQEFSAAPLFVGSETREEIIEHERQRIARELHDSVSQQLFAAMMMLSAINEVEKNEEMTNHRKQLIKVEEIISNAQTEMRALLLHLRPVELNDKSLKEGITQLLNELKNKIPIELIYQLEDTQMESGIEDHLFRIVQEAVSNTLRHARATKLEVYLQQDHDTVSLKIIDDGVGFDIERIGNIGTYGLANMKERINGLGGTIKIVSLKNQGTIIDISTPIQREKLQMVKEGDK